MEEDLSKASLIASIPPIVNEVLRNLPAKQLNKCARVCSLWQGIANSIKKQRHRISWYFFYYCREESLGDSHCVPCHPKDKSNNCLESFIRNLDSLLSEPSLVLIFSSKSLICRSEPYFSPSRPKKRKLEIEASNEPEQHDAAHHPEVLHHPVISNLLPFLPRNSDVGFCTARGVTGTSSDNSLVKEIEFCPALSVVYFPQLPGVKIHRFPLSGLRSATPINYAAHTGIPEDTPVKCMLVFLYERIGDYYCLPYNKIIGHYLMKQDWQMALGGAYVEHMYFPKHKPRRRNQCYGIAFTGENVEAASIIITKDMETESNITQQLKLMNKTSLLQGQCVAFMFTCVGRGTGYYDRTDVESGIFRKIFPDIPLFGVFGNGEIGISYVPNQKCLVKKKKPGCWMESYASVFVIISVRK